MSNQDQLVSSSVDKFRLSCRYNRLYRNSLSVTSLPITRYQANSCRVTAKVEEHGIL